MSSQKKQVIKIKRIISSILCVVLLASLFVSCGKGSGLQVFSADNELFATIKSDKAINKDENKAYLEIVMDEASEIISKSQNIEIKEARKVIYKNKYKIYTAFDKKVSDNLLKSCDKKDDKFKVAAAITDLNANLVAVYSSKDGQKGTNFATKSNRPCSALKPLSVYAPALDDGTVNWSSRYKDSPYKYVKNLEGVMRPWPSNANYVYSEKYAYIYQAIMESINTVAVKCLTDYGIMKSVSFLENSFGIPLEAEKTLAAANGEEEILGNIALGFLSNGVSCVDMAGYYQIFANGGKYGEPKAILKICDKKGNIVYEREHSQKQVIKDTTAEIMNRMLKEVVSPDGTGKAVSCKNFEVAGKTGTDEDYKNNWFVGITPEYSCAVWHDYYFENTAAKIFSDAMNEIYNAKEAYQKVFGYNAPVTQIAYCTESGKQFKQGCSFIKMGYYTQDKVPGICDRH